ncbi:MAG: sigma-54 dependent transcriptional regulator [Gammaproteobacteria bacterium]
MRKMLYLKSVGAPESLDSELQAAGWDLHTASDTQQARLKISEHDFRIGLAFFTFYDERTDHDIEEFFQSTSHIEWVALVSQECLQSPTFGKHILRMFHDYHTLPPEIPRLLSTLGHAYGMAQVKNLIVAHDGKLGEYEMVGTSPSMQKLFSNIRKISSVDAPVLIAGESGTGKELAALAIHERSTRSGAAFVAVNCGSLPTNLIQSELFGHEKGAFTGAHQRKIGRIESAAGGTLFLDEVGDLALDLQVNLLRFLQEKTIERVGGIDKIQVDVRVIAATHVNLENAVKEGRFREDLYYRLNVLHLEVPALRDREEDIELLARFFFDKFAKEKNRNVKGFRRDALQTINDYIWPGNVREMINRIRRAMVMCENRLITSADLGLDRRASQRRLVTLDEARNKAEKEAIQFSLRTNRNNVSKAARQLGVSRVTLYRLMEKYEITPQAPTIPG